MTPLILHHRRCEWQKGAIAPKRAGYGQRKLAREQAKAPLFANDPDVVGTAEEYDQNMRQGLTRAAADWRHFFATGWWRIIQWRSRATGKQRDAFRRRWNSRWLPHDPTYALDIITQIERGIYT